MLGGGGDKKKIKGVQNAVLFFVILMDKDQQAIKEIIYGLCITSTSLFVLGHTRGWNYGLGSGRGTTNSKTLAKHRFTLFKTKLSHLQICKSCKWMWSSSIINIKTIIFNQKIGDQYLIRQCVTNLQVICNLWLYVLLGRNTGRLATILFLWLHYLGLVYLLCVTPSILSRYFPSLG